MSLLRYTGCKRPRELTLAVYDHAAAEQRAKLSAGAGALIPFAAPAASDEPINAVPLRTVAPPKDAPRRRSEPSWIRKDLFRRLHLRYDLPVHFIDEKTVTVTDLDAHQNRFRIPNDGVQRHLRSVLSQEELGAANLLDEALPKPSRQPPPLPPPTDGEEGAKRKKRRGKKHGGLPVFVVDVAAGVKELQLSRWESSRGTIIKGEGYLDFINQCSFKEKDVVEIWAFKQRPFHYFGATFCVESPLYVVISKKEQ